MIRNPPPSTPLSLYPPLAHTPVRTQGPVPTPFIIVGVAEKQFVLGVTDLMQSALLHAPE